MSQYLNTKLLIAIFLLALVGCNEQSEDKPAEVRIGENIQDPNFRAGWRKEVNRQISKFKKNPDLEIDFFGTGAWEASPEPFFSLEKTYKDKPNLKKLRFSSQIGWDGSMSTISKFSQLEWLHISCPDVKQIDIDFRKLPNLQRLVIHCRNLEEIPTSLKSLRKLKRLAIYISDAQVRNLDELIFDFPELTVLEIHDVNADSVPLHESIGSLARLRRLQIDETNALLPAALYQLDSLEELELDLRYQPFTLELEHFSNLKHLVVQYDSNDVISFSSANESLVTAELQYGPDVPFSLKEAPALKLLTLYNLEMNRLPSEFFAASSLIHININSCYQLAHLQGDFMRFPNLLQIELDGSGITTISDSVTMSPSLKFINYRGYQLQIPEELATNPTVYFTNLSKHGLQ